jgi:hypothetical protein
MGLCQATGDKRCIFFLRLFLCSALKARFFVPTRTSLTLARAGAVKVGRRTNLLACSAVARPHLDSSEHDGTLGAIGITIRGEPAFGARINRATALYSVGARTRTMMQLCASAAKLRDGGPILPFGIESQGNTSGPATSNHHRRFVTSGPIAPKLLVTSASSVHHAGRRTMPSGTTPS